MSATRLSPWTNSLLLTLISVIMCIMCVIWRFAKKTCFVHKRGFFCLKSHYIFAAWMGKAPKHPLPRRHAHGFYKATSGAVGTRRVYFYDHQENHDYYKASHVNVHYNAKTHEYQCYHGRQWFPLPKWHSKLRR